MYKEVEVNQKKFLLIWITEPMLQFIMQRIVGDMSNAGEGIKAALGHQLAKKGMAGHMNINYAEKYKAKYKVEADLYSAWAYDAVKLYAMAINNAKSTKPDDIKAELIAFVV